VDKKSGPIAKFKKEYRYHDRFSNPPRDVFSPATLTFSQRGEDIQDLAVISFLLLEKVRRIKENSVTTLAAGLAVAPKIK